MIDRDRPNIQGNGSETPYLVIYFIHINYSKHRLNMLHLIKVYLSKTSFYDYFNI